MLVGTGPSPAAGQTPAPRVAPAKVVPPARIVTFTAQPTSIQAGQPVLLVCGDRDPLVGPARSEELLRGLPRAVRVELPECGHNPQFTHPGALAELVHRFLTPPDEPHGPGAEAAFAEKSSRPS